jgi:hypothetical protein
MRNYPNIEARNMTLPPVNPIIDRNAPTPASFWAYHAGSATPSHAEALELGAIDARTTDDAWQSLTPGMRREIVRSHLKRTAAKL